MRKKRLTRQQRLFWLWRSLLALVLLSFCAWGTAPVAASSSHPGNFVEGQRLVATAPIPSPSPSATPVAPTGPAPSLLPALQGEIVQRTLAEPTRQWYTDIVGWLNRENSILIWTSPTTTYENQAVRSFWGLLLVVANSTLVLFLLLAGYQIMLGGFSSHYATALELLPRIFLAFLGANVSLFFASFWIQLNNILSKLMSDQVQNQPLPLVDLALLFPSLGAPLLVLFFIYCILLSLVGFQMLFRLGLLIFLIILLPLFFVLFAFPKTQNVAEAGLRAYIGAALSQFLQVACLAVGTKMLLPFLLLSIGPDTTTLTPVTTILAGMVVLFLTLKIPGLLRNWLLAPMATGRLSHIAITASRLIFF